jgi:hypothetical protein
MKDYLSLCASHRFEDVVRTMEANKLTDEELLESNVEFRLNYIGNLAKIVAGECNAQAHNARLVMAAMSCAGYSVNLYQFGTAAGLLMLERFGDQINQADLASAIYGVLSFDEDEG